MWSRRSHQWALSFAGEINSVLGEFLRGQAAVILIMCVYSVVGLWMAGLEYSLPIGILSGLLVFVPYLGVLLALPASAALLVGLRHLRAQYLASDLFES
ncbi:MAG: AI-2E family transporter [Burkholderiales bacterium]